jgi:putative ABC transport system permease protein
VLTLDSRRLVETASGHQSPLVVPWGVLAGGVAAVVALSIIAGLLPAWRLSRAEPLTLLQAGRSAT